MFACCTSKFVLDSVDVTAAAAVPADASPTGDVVSTSDFVNKTQLKLATVGAKARLLPEVEPRTPDLTAEEISKIQANLQTIKIFNEKVWIQQGLIINEVYMKLQHQINQDKNTDDKSIRTFFENWLEICAILNGVGALIPTPLAPVCAILAIVCGTTASLLSTDGKAAAVIGGSDISGKMGDHATLNNEQFYGFRSTLDFFLDNTNDSRDYILTYQDKTGTLRDLLKADFVTGTYFDSWLLLSARMFKRKIVLPELVSGQFLDVYFIEDAMNGHNVEFGHVYQPCAAPAAAGTQRERALDAVSVGKGVGIFANDEVMHYLPEYGQANGFGSSDVDLSGSFVGAIGSFVGSFISAYVYPWAVTDTRCYSQRWYIIEGVGKLKDDENKPKYGLCNGGFLNWLFIDDGAGNIINPNGVAFRYDVFRTKAAGFDNDVFLHAQQISDEIPNLPTKYLSSSTEFRYGPADSRDNNKVYRVYTGDLVMH